MQGSLQKYFYFLAAMLMATTYLPIIFNNLPPLIRSHHLWVAIWAVSILFLQPKILLDKGMLYVLFFGLIMFIASKTIWINMDEINSKFIFLEFYNISVGVSVITYFSKNNDYLGLAKLTKLTCLFLVVTAITTIVSASIDPMYARNSYGTSIQTESEVAAVNEFKKYGGGNYGTAAAFMCLLPIIIYYYKNMNKCIFSKKQIVATATLFFLALIGMQIFANILVAVACAILALLGVRKLKKSILIIGVFFSVVLIIPKDNYVDALFSLSNYFDKASEISYKLQDLATFISIGGEIDNSETGTGGRAERFPLLLDAFQKSPVFGCFFLTGKNENPYPIGGYHLHWMNKLTVTGVVGLFGFIVIPFYFIKKQIKTFSSEYKLYYLIASFSILGYGIIKTLAGRETWYAFFILLSGLYYLPLLKNSPKKI